jgi:hypothetical protein
MEDPKQIKVVFAPGSFDNFEGTQEELDEFITEITAMCQDPAKMIEMSRPLDMDDLSEDDEELISKFLQADNTSTRVLQ